MNKYCKYKLFNTSLLILLLVGMESCSSDDNTIDTDENTPNRNSTITMKMDGEDWSSQYAGIVTAKDYEDNDSEEYYVIMTASREDGNEETTETLTISILIDPDKFHNPKGTYPFYEDGLEEAPVNYAQAVYVDFNNSKSYISGDPESTDNIVGEIEVTGYEIGEQMLGSGEGYIKLSGTFSINMYSFSSGDTTDKLEIREGKFSVEHAILF